MKYLGLDLGSVTCGYAISDAFGMIARVHSTFRFPKDNYKLCLEHTLKIIKEENIGCVVLGYPKHMNGDIGERCKISEKFKMRLQESWNGTVILWDERLTSVTVNKAMLENNTSRSKRKEKKDELAAVVILQSYLDSK